MKIFALRLKPEQDLKQSLQTFVVNNNIQAGFILTAVGSLQQATIRYANQNQSQVLVGKFEIVSLVGTLSVNGLHLHISIADSEGITKGGHLVDGCLIYTTAEIAIGESESLVFSREVDRQTGYLELEIKQRTEFLM